jgi:hypothetical protein
MTISYLEVSASYQSPIAQSSRHVIVDNRQEVRKYENRPSLVVTTSACRLQIATQMGATHVVAHLTAYDETPIHRCTLWGVGPSFGIAHEQMWTYENLINVISMLQNTVWSWRQSRTSPNFWYDVLLTVPRRQSRWTLKRLVRDAAAPSFISYNFVAGV